MVNRIEDENQAWRRSVWKIIISHCTESVQLIRHCTRDGGETVAERSRDQQLEAMAPKRQALKLGTFTVSGLHITQSSCFTWLCVMTMVSVIAFVSWHLDHLCKYWRKRNISVKTITSYLDGHTLISILISRILVIEQVRVSQDGEEVCSEKNDKNYPAFHQESKLK